MHPVSVYLNSPKLLPIVNDDVLEACHYISVKNLGGTLDDKSMRRMPNKVFIIYKHLTNYLNDEKMKKLNGKT